ncbi:hypothetical protein [Ferruginibacter profundus]
MKKLIVLIILLPVFSSVVKAQRDSSGIYKTADDFAANKLSFAINCQTEKHKIYLNDFFNKAYITVKHKDSTYKVFRKDIYGYHFCNGETFRIANRYDIQVLNQDEYIIIYRRNITHPPTGKTNVTNYYFSKGPYSTVQQLTFKNLKKTFSENQKFYRQLDSMFKYNTELAAYDTQHKMYVINRIYKQSQE